MLRILPLAVMLCLIVSCTALKLSAPPKADYEIVDGLNYPDDEAARKAWKPIGETAPVSVIRTDGRTVLRMPCNFKGTKIDRVSWDRAVNLDLTTFQGIQFKVFCPDASPVSYFTLYLQSGSGWYSQSFAVNKKDEWNTIRIDKPKTQTEGTPTGWGKIETIRISAWRGKDVNTELYVSDIGKLGPGI